MQGCYISNWRQRFVTFWIFFQRSHHLLYIITKTTPRGPTIRQNVMKTRMSRLMVLAQPDILSGHRWPRQVSSKHLKTFWHLKLSWPFAFSRAFQIHYKCSREFKWPRDSGGKFCKILIRSYVINLIRYRKYSSKIWIHPMPNSTSAPRTPAIHPYSTAVDLLALFNITWVVIRWWSYP